MYANNTDYKSLYNANYFGKLSGITSFDQNRFITDILDFCTARNLTYVVDIGSGSGTLARILRSSGINVLTCDFEPVDADGIHFDLSGPPGDAAKILERIRSWTNGNNWLMTCLDVLEHVDADDVFSALRNLRSLCDGEKSCFIASISTRPSSANNKFHATILPAATWLELLRTVGFKVEEPSIFEAARTIRREFPNDEGLELVAYWARCDLFHDVELGEPVYALLSADETKQLDQEKNQLLVEDILDISYRRAKRAQFNLGLKNTPQTVSGGNRVGFNLHHIQEFVLYRPLFDVLAKNDIVILVRTTVLDPQALSLVKGIVGRCGLQAIFYERANEIPWRELNITYLFTGAESNITAPHIMGRQIVEAAKLHCIHTVQLQHGIWIEQFPERLIEFGSESIWSWGQQYEDFIINSHVSLSGKTVKGKDLSAQKFAAIGGAKFVDLQLPAPFDLIRWRLGQNTDNFRVVALLGTNLLWPRHGASSDFTRQRLINMMQSAPDVLFIVKLHPIERASEARELRQPNALVLDDLLMGMLDIHITRLIAAVNIVISSLSTLLLDAAVAGKPCIQYGTMNDLSYEGIESVEIEQLAQILKNFPAIPLKSSLMKRYAESYDEPFYQHLAAFIGGEQPTLAPRETIEASAASYYSVATEVETLWNQRPVEELKRLQEAETELQRLQPVEMEVERLKLSEEVLSGEIQKLQATNEALRNDTELARIAAEREIGRERAVGADDVQRLTAQRDALLNEIERVRAESEAAVTGERSRAEEMAANELAMRAQLDAVYRSRSWRLTLPMRKIRNLF